MCLVAIGSLVVTMSDTTTEDDANIIRLVTFVQISVLSQWGVSWISVLDKPHRDTPSFQAADDRVYQVDIGL